jgi:hypothetical protein
VIVFVSGKTVFVIVIVDRIWVTRYMRFRLPNYTWDVISVSVIPNAGEGSCTNTITFFFRDTNTIFPNTNRIPNHEHGSIIQNRSKHEAQNTTV